MALPLDVRHHQQDTFDSCGRACAQMIIGFEFARLGDPSGTPLPDQTTTMASAETGKLKNWYTEPAELAAHINSGLQARPDAMTWKVVECKPSPGVTGAAANVEVAGALLAMVVQKLNAGFPSVVMIDDNDHWETAYNWGGDVGNESGGIVTPTMLYMIDPSPALVAPLGTPHSDSDACFEYQDTIWFIDSTSAGALVCNAAPFVGSAIGIVQGKPSPWSAGTAVHGPLGESPMSEHRPDPRFLDAWRERAVVVNIRDPLPPLDTNLPLIALMNFFKRDMWLMNNALARLPDAASYSDFDWSKVVVRHAAYQKHPDRKIALVAAPPTQGKERSILLSLNQRGSVDALHLTSSVEMVKSLASASDDPLWIMPKYSRWLPFARIGEGPGARFRRLYDGYEVEMPPEGPEQR